MTQPKSLTCCDARGLVRDDWRRTDLGRFAESAYLKVARVDTQELLDEALQQASRWPGSGLRRLLRALGACVNVRRRATHRSLRRHRFRCPA